MLHLDHSTEPGGAELALVRMLAAGPGWRATVAVPRGRATRVGVFEPVADRVVTLGPAQWPGASRDGSYLLQAVNLARLVAAAVRVRGSRQFRDVEIVHANTARSTVYGAIACAGTRKAFVIQLRDIVDRPSLGRAGVRLFVGIGLRRADALVANSAATLRSALPHAAPGVPVAVIPSAAGLRRLPSVPTPRAEVARIGMVARIDDWKGHEVVLRAFAKEFAGTPVRLGFAGGAPFGKAGLLDELVRLTRALGVADQVDFHGHVADVEAFVSDQDICVHASTRPEPLGQNVLQYLAGGRPTVAVDEGGPVEWIDPGVNGLLYRMGSVEELADTLRLLAADPALRARLATGAARTPGLLSDAEVARRTERFFHEVLRRKQGAPAAVGPRRVGPAARR